MRNAWAVLLFLTLAPAACGNSGDDDDSQTKSPGGAGGAAGSSTAAGASGTAGSNGVGGAVDPKTCAMCDVAQRCCFAAVGQSYCSAYSTAECLKKADPVETIDDCRIEVDAA